MKTKVVISDGFLIELSLKLLDELEDKCEKLLAFDICESEKTALNKHLSSIENARGNLFELRRSLQ